MKNLNFSMIIMLVLAVLFAGNINAQTTNYGTGTGLTATQVVRNTNLITYTVNNSNGTNATFTWTVTGGTIVVGGADQVSPYTQVGTAAATSSIQVRWNNAQTSAVNNGTLTVTKTIDNGGGNICTSTVQSVAIESWVAPGATSPTADFTVCSGTNISTTPIDLSFTGKSDYRYAWQLVRSSDNAVVAQSAGELTSATATASVSINYAVTAGTTGNETYTFRVTYMYDDFTDFSAASSGNVTNAIVAITVLATPEIGPVQSSSSLVERP